MNYLIIILILIIIGLGVWIWYLLKNKNSQFNMPELMQRQAKEKEENKQKIFNFLAGKEKISNNEIVQLLGVSDATAVRYLDELEEEGVVKQVGKTGRDVYYEKA